MYIVQVILWLLLDICSILVDFGKYNSWKSEMTLRGHMTSTKITWFEREHISSFGRHREITCRPKFWKVCYWLLVSEKEKLQVPFTSLHQITSLFSPFVASFPSVLWYCWLGPVKLSPGSDNLYCVGGDVKHCSINPCLHQTFSRANSSSPPPYSIILFADSTRDTDPVSLLLFCSEERLSAHQAARRLLLLRVWSANLSSESRS